MESKESSVRAPRLITIARAAKGYGFNLHGERGIVGQYISAVDDGGPADAAGLCIGDRVVEVNSVNVEAATHSQVVSKIREVADQTMLLVVDKVTDDYMKQHEIQITAELAKLDTVTSLQKQEETVAKVEVEPEEEQKVTTEANDTSNVQVSHDETKADDEQEETGVSVEDYLRSMEVEDKPVADTEQSDAATVPPGDSDQVGTETVSTTNEPPAESSELNVNEQTQHAETAADPVEQERPEIVATAASEPPVDESSEPSEPSKAEEQEPMKESEVMKEEPAKEPEAVNAVEPVKEQEQPTASEPTQSPEAKTEEKTEAKTEAKTEPAPANSAEPSKAYYAEPPPSYQQSESTKKAKSLSLPKPKRKEIKEKQSGNWASKAAMFENL